MSSIFVDTSRGPGTPFPPTMLFVLGFLGALWINNAIPIGIGGPDLETMRIGAGIVTLVFGTGMFWWGMATFAGRTNIMLQKPARQVVTVGPYQFSRNPMYVGFVSMYFGLSLLANTLWPLVFLPAIIALLVWIVISREERYMRATFGAEYDAYCRRVRRWL
jgi:protein-S-isoprenylcysteine O-methyltransferase Ste14